jgi:hypothetical protein
MAKKEDKRQSCRCTSLNITPWKRMGESRHSCNTLDLGTRWRWVPSFMLRPLYTRGMRPGYPSHRRLGESQSLSGRCQEEVKLLPLPRNEPRTSSP